jgi:phosphatidylinositol-3-phosphatase
VRRGLLAVTLLLAAAVAAPAAAVAAPIRHVFVIVLENESASTTFGPNSPAPYLSQTLRSQGVYLPKYYAVGHESNDNYIAMISGQAPSAQNQADCQVFDDVIPGTIGAYGQAQGAGCVYPAAVQTIASQLTADGFTWADYNEDMGADPTRETSVCGHPSLNSSDDTQKATPADEYATRHNPFVYFHSIIHDTELCDTHVLDLDQLPQALASYAATPNYVFITPDLCDDGHDAPCVNGQPGGLAQADRFLQTWVPQITGSPAFRQDGLLIVTFDEAATSDTSSCCGEIPGPDSPEPGVGGPGGGDVGAVLLSPCIAPGTVSPVAYNHYSMLRSVEDIFGLAHLGYAQLPGETSFGADIFTRSCGSGPPMVAAHSPPLQSSASTTTRIRVRWSPVSGGTGSVASYTVRVRDSSVHKPGWRTLSQGTAGTSLSFPGTLGHTYTFEVQALDPAGQAGNWSRGVTTVVPTAARPTHGRFSPGWRGHRVRGAWHGHTISSHRPGANFRLRFRGGTLWLIGERWRAGGIARVTLDGRRQTIHLRASGRRLRQVVYRARLRSHPHRLTVRVLRGTVTLEGVAIASRTE